MNPETIRVTREELYEQVWSRPMRDLAKEYGLSDVGLAKICRKLEIPLPGRGYWARIDAGSAPARPTLLPTRNEMQTTAVFYRDVSPPPDVHQAEEAERLIACERSPENRIHVGSELEKPHPLTVRTEKSLRAAKADETGRVCPRAQHCFNVRVTKNSIDRSLRIADALIKALEERHFQVVAKDDQDIQIQVLGVDHKIAIEERTLRKPRELTTVERKRKEKNPWLFLTQQFEYLPTGKLTLRIENHGYGTRQSWSDGKQQRIEDCLNDFVIGLIRASVRIQAARLEREQREKEWEEEKRLRREAEIARKLQEARIGALNLQIDAWERSKQIRAYIEAVRRKALEQTGSILPESDLGRWITWAANYAESLNPVCADVTNIRLVDKQEVVSFVSEYL